MTTTLVLDRDQLRQLTDGDVEFERELLATYRQSVAHLLTRLRAGLSAGDVANAARQAHALKGASFNIGANAMGQCAAQIETAARAGDLAAAHEIVRQLAREEEALWAEFAQIQVSDKR